MNYPEYGLREDEFIRLALQEDAGDGDHTSLSTIKETDRGSAGFKVKENGVLCGLRIALKVMKLADPHTEVALHARDGDIIQTGTVVMSVKGRIQSLLLAERLSLNFLQRMSGIATLTRKYVDAVSGTGVKVLDTRKTTPNFRPFEKEAVLAGGGINHRFGLFDMILIKDNHVDASGGIRSALENAASYIRKTGKVLKIEIETRTLKEVEEAVATGIPHRIMLDNFKPEMLSEAVKIIGNKMETEASGGITLENISDYARTGVQFISVGALTHSYRSLDISMKYSGKI